MEDTAQPVTEAAAVANMALNSQATVPVEVLELEGRHHVFTPKRDSHGTVVGVDHRILEPRDHHGLLTDKPSRVAGAVTVETQDSLVDYVRDFKTTGSRLFASISGNAIVAVLDYHAGRTDAVKDMGGQAADPDTLPNYEAEPDHGQHTATLQLAYSEPWTLWTGQDGRTMGQVDFARFIHENAADVASPDGATLLELVKDLRGTRSKRFTGDVNLNAVRDSFTYEDRTTVSGSSPASGQLDVPDGFTLSLPVYFGGDKVTVHAQLRHEVTDDGQLQLGFKLLRKETVRQDAFQRVVDFVAEGAGCPVVYGSRATR